MILPVADACLVAQTSVCALPEEAAENRTD
jgi:hypothetical protein